MKDEFNIMFLYGWGPEEEGRLSSLFYMVGTAAAMGMTVAVFFFTDGALLARRGVYSNINEKLRTMFNSARKKKVKFYVCEQAARKRGLEEADVEEGFTVIGYSTFLDLATSAGTVITV